MSRITGYTSDNLKFVSSGLCPNCEDCKNNYGYDSIDEFNLAAKNGEIDDEGSFSWSPCDDCNTSLGGNSYAAHGIDDNNELNHFRICYDCLMEYNGYTWNEEFQHYEGG